MKLVVADDHTLVRAGFVALLRRIPELDVVGEADNGRAALRLIDEHKPAVALLDISMPELNGLEATVRATKDHPHTRVLILSMHADEEYVRRALVSGAAGYLLKTASEAELELAVRTVARGENWFSPGVAKPIFDEYARASRGTGRPSSDALTPRQREVLQLIAEGHSIKDIARALELSIKTVETHRAQIMDRLAVHNVQGLVRYAIRVGIISS